MGNRIADTAPGAATLYTYDAANRLLERRTNAGAAADTVTSYTVDAAGRRTGESGTTWTKTMTYDGAGRISAVTMTDIAGVHTDVRKYNGDDRLVEVVSTEPGVPAVTTGVRWDPADPVSQPLVLERGGIPANLVYGIDRAWLDTPSADAPFLADIYGSALETPATAAFVQSSSYDAFGSPRSSGVGIPEFGYRGELTSSEWLHLRAREYDAMNGVFTTADPLDGIAGSVSFANGYPYALNDPLNMVDPEGLRAVSDPDVRRQLSDSTVAKAAYLFGTLQNPGRVQGVAKVQMWIRTATTGLAIKRYLLRSENSGMQISENEYLTGDNRGLNINASDSQNKAVVSIDYGTRSWMLRVNPSKTNKGNWADALPIDGKSGHNAFMLHERPNGTLIALFALSQSILRAPPISAIDGRIDMPTDGRGGLGVPSVYMDRYPSIAIAFRGRLIYHSRETHWVMLSAPPAPRMNEL